MIIDLASQTTNTIYLIQVYAMKKYWIEYKPRNHAQRVEHHFAYEIDDVHHIKSILRKHHKPGLI